MCKSRYFKIWMVTLSGHRREGEKTRPMKKESHTGFRNEKLFCYHCGESQTMPVPIHIEIATAMMKAFEKIHKNCKKTWVEPVNDPEGKGELENERWWIANGEHGISSKTMFNRLRLS